MLLAPVFQAAATANHGSDCLTASCGAIFRELIKDLAHNLSLDGLVVAHPNLEPLAMATARTQPFQAAQPLHALVVDVSALERE